MDLSQEKHRPIIIVGFYKSRLDGKLKLYQESATPLNKLAVGNAYLDVGDAYRTANDYVKAIQYYVEAFKIRLQIYADNITFNMEVGDIDHVAIGKDYHIVGNIYEDSGYEDNNHFNYALDNYKIALTFMLKSYQNEPSNINAIKAIGNTCTHMAAIYCMLDQIQKSEKATELATICFMRAYDSSLNRPVAIDIKKKINDLFITSELVDVSLSGLNISESYSSDDYADT